MRACRATLKIRFRAFVDGASRGDASGRWIHFSDVKTITSGSRAVVRQCAPHSSLRRVDARGGTDMRTTDAFDWSTSLLVTRFSFLFAPLSATCFQRVMARPN